MVGGCTLDRFGRRATLLMAYILGMCAYALLFTPLATPNAVGWIWLLVGLVQGLMWPALNTYLAEVFPTRVCCTGIGTAATFGRIANIAAPWAVGRAMLCAVPKD